MLLLLAWLIWLHVTEPVVRGKERGGSGKKKRGKT